MTVVEYKVAAEELRSRHATAEAMASAPQFQSLARVQLLVPPESQDRLGDIENLVLTELAPILGQLVPEFGSHVSVTTAGCALTANP